MSTEPQPTHAQFLAELRRLCAERRSGTLFIATANNQSGRLGLLDGQIVSARFQLRSGLEAVDEISKVGSARFTFTEGQADAATVPLPPTQDVLRLLGSDGVPLPPQPRAQPPLTDPALIRAHNVLVTALAEFVGPMANLIVREALSEANKQSPDFRKIVDVIARAVEDPAKAALFKQQVLPKLVDRPVS